MKKVVELIEYLKARNVELGLSGENIRFRGSRMALTPEIMDEMKSHKAEIISYLNLETAPDGTPLRNSILLGDSQHWLKSVPDNSIDLMATDPPYGMKFMGKAWDKALPKVEIWKECLRVLKPGAFAFVMCIPRQDLLSRMIADLETAGFDTGFTSIYWTFASGFPKAHNVSKAVDKKLGYEREIIAAHPLTAAGFFDKIDDSGRRFHQSDCQGYKLYEYNGITKPRSEQAKKFDGSYAGFQPKPAAEVILVAMKPCAENSFTDQALANGKAVTWLDDCRIPYGDELPSIGDRHLHDRGDGYGFNPQYQGEPASPAEERLKRDLELIAHEKGRFPANLIISNEILDDGRKYHSGSWCRWQNGSKTFGGSKGDSYTQWQKVQETSHGFSRFFSLDAWAEKNLPFLMVPKASKKEKEAGLEEEIERIVQEDYPTKENNVPNKLRPELRKNPHPTVKPLKLMAYLVTMGSREGDIVLDPFCGSGTTCIAAMMLKRDFIGIEISQEYQEIALKRIEHFRRKKAA